MPARMAYSFAEGSNSKLEVGDPDKTSFSFTQLLMNGEAAWQGIDPGTNPPAVPSVLPQSDFVVNPPSGADECVIHVPPPPNAREKKRKASSSVPKDLSCITTTPKDSEAEERDASNKKQKSAKDERSKGEGRNNHSNAAAAENKGSKQGKENSKPAAAPKQDYIHVRARRGQATDSHSLAERVRREKISERMKLLQDLVPGCSKVTGKAMMLDEIINYVQSLQRQVEFLSMKLASVKPRLDLYHDTYLVNEMLPGAQDASGFSDLLHEPQQAWQSSPMAAPVENCS